MLKSWQISAAVAIVAAVAAAAYFYVSHVQERNEALAAQRREAAERELCTSAAKTLRRALEVWRDSVELSLATPRVALAGPVAALQKQANDVMALPLPHCATAAQQALNQVIRHTASSFIEFMGNADSRLSLAGTKQLLHEFEREVSYLEGCDETCWRHKQQFAERARIASEEQRRAEALKLEAKHREDLRRYEEQARQRRIHQRLDQVRNVLHNPGSAEFLDVVYNEKTDAVCGYLNAVNARGVTVKNQAFAADSTSAIVGVDHRGLNVGGHAAARLCGLPIPAGTDATPPRQ